MLHLTTIDLPTYSLLKDLFAIDIIHNHFALAGGTSLALQIGHRKSIDLDLFTLKPFNIKELEIILSTNPGFSFKYLGNNSRMLFSTINGIKCDFIQDPSSLLESFHEIEMVRYFGIRDIACMKLLAVCGRGKKKVFFDIYALLNYYSWQTLIAWFIEKYGKDQMFYLWRSIIYFDDADKEPDIDGLPPYLLSWEEIKIFIAQKCS
jgi:hypothetical protein